MLAIVFTLFTLAFSYTILRAWGSRTFDSALETLMVSIPVGICSIGLLVSVFGIALPILVSALLALLVLGILATIAFVRNRKTIVWLPRQNLSLGDKVFYGIIAALLLALLAAIDINTFQMHKDGTATIALRDSFDVLYHLSQIMRSGLTSNWHFQEPNFSGEFIRYPYLIDLYSGIMVQLRAGLSWAYHIPVMLLIMSLVYGLVAFYRYLKLNKIWVLASVLLVLFGGGLAYLTHYDINALPITIHYPLQHVNYVGYVANFFASQRTFIIGLPIFVLALLYFLKGLDRDEPQPYRWAGLLAGFLPLAHTHSFIAVIIVVGLAIIYLAVTRNAKFFDAVRGFVFVVSAVAVPQLLALFGLTKYSLGGIPVPRLGWMSDATAVGGLNLPYPGAKRLIPWINYMLLNFGALLLLPLAAVVAGITFFFQKKKVNHFVILLLGALGLWIVPQFIQFQTWDFDTNKFFTYALVVSAAALGVAVRSLSGRGRKVGTTLFALLVIASLPLSIIKVRYKIYSPPSDRLVIFTSDQRSAAQWLRDNTPEDATIVSSAVNVNRDSAANVVTLASGRRTSVGFITLLYTHNIDYEKRMQAVQSFFANPGQAKQLLADVPADYIVIDPALRRQYPSLEPGLLNEGYKSVYHNPTIDIIALK